MDLLTDLRTDKALHRNLLKFATMLTVSKAISVQDAKFMTSTIATLVGFTAYHLVTKKIDLPIQNPQLKKLSQTWAKVGTMLVVSQLYKGNALSEAFLMDSVFTLLGFNVADVLVPRLVPTFQNTLMNKIATDAAVVFISTGASTLLKGEKVGPRVMMKALWTLAGFVMYDMIEELACD